LHADRLSSELVAVRQLDRDMRGGADDAGLPSGYDRLLSVSSSRKSFSASITATFAG